jgi:hypothetical protein
VAKQRAVRDYNESGRAVRTAKWWFAPENVTPKSKKRWGLYLLGVGAVAAGALLVSFIHPSGQGQGQGQEQVTAQLVSPPAPTPVLEPVCPAQDPVPVPPETLVLTTFDSVWVRDGGMSRPTSTTGGPFQGAPFPSCFSRTPEGALYSAANFATGVLAATDAGDEKPFFASRASHSGNYNVLIADLPGEGAGTVTNRPISSISGYRWNSYSPDTASVEIRYSLLTGASSGEQTAITYNLTWENNDWLLVVPGKSDQMSVLVDENRSYIPWGTT